MTLKLTKNNKKSAYAVDRVKFPANESISKTQFNNKIIIIEPDVSLSFLLETTAQMQGYKAMSYDYSNDTIKEIKKIHPSVIILDMGNLEQKEGIALCKKIKAEKAFNKTKIILTSNVHNKEEILNAGADIYLPKPYDLTSIYNWVEKFIKEYNY